MTTTMRTSVLASPGDVRIERRPVPVPDADQVLVRVAAVGVCGSDVHYYREGRIGDFVVESPLVLGHEASGTIVDVGRAVSPSRIGERVSIEPQRACRVCDDCRHGRYNLCARMEFYATPPVDGAFAELVTIQADYAHPLPDAVSLEAGALCEPLSVGIWANRKARVTAGARVLIAGAGPVGILIAQTARAFGASEVIMSDPSAERRAAAARLGATAVVDPTAGESVGRDGEADAFIDASGAAAAMDAGIRAVRPAGRVVLVGMGAPEVPLPVGRIQNRELEVTGVFRYANTWPLAIELIRDRRVDVEALITGRFGLDEVEAALLSTADPTSLKSLVLPTR